MDILNWNGADLPETLRHLPPGRYVLQPVDDAPPLSPEQDARLRRALDAVDQGQGHPHEVVVARLKARIAGR